MNTALLIFYLLLTLYITWRINKKYIPETNPLILPSALMFKYIYAFFFYFIYTVYYGGGELTADAGRFFEESKILHEVFYTSPGDFFQFLFGLNNAPEFINTYLSQTNHWNAGEQFLLNDSRNVMRANALFLFISNGSVYVHFLLFSFASFLGGIDLYQFVKRHSNIPKTLLLLIILLAPSIAFWSSSIIKEPLLILGLFIFIRGVFDALPIKRRLWRILLGGILLIGFKPYVFIAVMVGLGFYLIFSRLTRYQLTNLIIFTAVGLASLYFTGSLNKMTHVISKQQEDFINVRDGGLYLDAGPNKYYYIYYNNRSNFKIEGKKAVLVKPSGAMIMNIDNNFDRRPLKLKQVGDTFDIEVFMTKAGSGFEITPIKDDLGTMITMIPEVLFNTYVRPLPHRYKNWLTMPAFIENIIYILALILAFTLYRNSTSTIVNRKLWSMAIIAVTISLIVGWTTPVAGAVVRYIIPAQALLLVIILIKFDWKQFVSNLFSSTRERS